MSTSFRLDETSNGQEIVARAHSRFARTTARKARLVADQVRGKTVGEAVEILRFLHRPSGSPFVLRTVLSAMKNAEEVHPEPETLVIAELRVEDGPILKRIRPRAMGRANRIRKRMCHIHVYLSEPNE